LLGWRQQLLEIKPEARILAFESRGSSLPFAPQRWVCFENRTGWRGASREAAHDHSHDEQSTGHDHGAMHGMINGHDHGHNHESSHAVRRNPAEHQSDQSGDRRPSRRLSFCSRRPFGFAANFRNFSRQSTAAGVFRRQRQSSGSKESERRHVFFHLAGKAFLDRRQRTGLVSARTSWC